MAQNKDPWPKTLNEIDVPEVVTEYSKVALTRMQIEALKVQVLKQILDSINELNKYLKEKKNG